MKTTIKTSRTSNCKSKLALTFTAIAREAVNGYDEIYFEVVTWFEKPDGDSLFGGWGKFGTMADAEKAATKKLKAVSKKYPA